MIDCDLSRRRARYLAGIKVFIRALRAARTFAADWPLLPSDWIFRSTSGIRERKLPIISVWRKDWHRAIRQTASDRGRASVYRNFRADRTIRDRSSEPTKRRRCAIIVLSSFYLHPECNCTCNCIPRVYLEREIRRNAAIRHAAIIAERPVLLNTIREANATILTDARSTYDTFVVFTSIL